MLFDYETLKLIWWVLIGVLLIGFAIADGMDMGVGTLLVFLGKNDEERRAIINTIGPHWDGNQVWFITAAAALFSAWPMVYAAAFSGFYFAMMIILFALFLRPIGFDYRSKIDDLRWRFFWDKALFVGSSVPPIIFGVAFGNLLQGVPFHFNEFLNITYTGSFLALLNPFALLCGVISLSMLIMQGALWLQMRTDDDIAERAKRAVKVVVLVLVAGFVLAGFWLSNFIDSYVIVEMPAAGSVFTPLDKTVALQSTGWLLNYQTMPLTMAFPLLGILGALCAWFFSHIKRPGMGFLASSMSIASIICTASFAMFPFLMPSSSDLNSSLTMWDAVSSHYTLNIMFMVVALLLPIILSYTFWCYRKMWRKVTVDEIKNNPHSTY
ncbi:MAG: cytochrome d ubiquinol oxidase subunit II [Pseudomonadales bacterium]|nr:cytochrome d ubiquinol oxidase subunit II [Pseudomonadales bacterium]